MKPFITYSLSKKEDVKTLWLGISILLVLIYAFFIFGINVLYLSVLSLTISFIIEYTFYKVRKIELSNKFFITPLLFVLLLPPTLPLWMAGVGIFFGTFFGKSLFGGDNKYIFHPSVIGVLFITISFPAFLNTAWLDPVTGVIVTSTPLQALASNTLTLSAMDLLLGNSVGTIGETMRLALIILGGLLISLKVIDWKLSLSFLGGFAAFTLILNFLVKDTARDPFSSLIVGGVILFSVFFVTDETTAPKKVSSRVIYGLGIAFITVIIRHLSAFPEGLIFAIVIMNGVSAYLDSSLGEGQVLKNE